MVRRGMHVLLGGLLVSSLALTGCPATDPGSTVVRPASSAAPVTPNTISNPNLNRIIIKGEVDAPASLDPSGGDHIVGDLDDGTDISLYKTLDIASTDRKVENALVTIKDSTVKVIPQLLSKYTDDQGNFYFKDVPPRVAFFMEARLTMKSKKYLLLGLTRTGSLGDVTGMQVDIPSTLVARLLLKIWQRSGFILDFNTIDPRDFNPLLAYLRDQFKNGQPSGVNVDLTAVSYPSGEWSATEDTKDSALVALSTLMAKDHNVWLFVKRIYDSLGKNMPPTDPKDPGASS